MKWRVIERAMAEISQMLDQGGMTSIDWFSDKLFKAFNISIVTKTERAIVMGWGSWKRAQSTPCVSKTKGHYESTMQHQSTHWQISP
jgi:hypothetical protein